MASSTTGRLPSDRWTRPSNVVALTAVALGILIGVLSAGFGRSYAPLFGGGLLLVAAAALAPIFLQRIHWLIVLFVGLMPIGVLGQLSGVGDEGIPLFNSVLQIMGIYVALLWVIRTIQTRSPIVVPRALLFVGLFLFMELVSSLLGPDRAGSLIFMARYYFPLAGFMLIFANAVRNERHLTLVVWAVVLSLAAASAIEMVHQLRLIDIPGLVYPEEAVRGRVGGIHGGLASTSFHLMIGIVLAVPLFRIHRSGWIRGVLLASIAVMAISNVFTYSISGMLSLVVALGLSSIRHVRLRWWALIGTTARAGVVAALLAVLLVSAVPFLGFRAFSKIADLGTIPFYMVASGRVGLWLGTLELIRDHPFGVGAGNTGPTLPRYLERYPEVYEALPEKFLVTYIEPHSTYLIATGEAGVLGGLFLGAAWFLALRRLGLAIAQGAGASSERLAGLGRALFSVTVGAALFIFVSDQLIDKYLWLLLALLVAYPAAVASRLGAAERVGVPQIPST